jgi:hypothetical protein
MHKRSNGYQVRKEDDVNLLDLDEFYKYIKDQYKTKVEYIDLDAMGGGNGNVLGVDITEDIILFYKPKRGHILLSWSRVKIPMSFLDELADRFKIENPNVMRRIITEKDGSCTNKTFVDVIEFFLGHKESMINESVWVDIHKRSNGTQIRKEDDVNLLDLEEFYAYIKNHYNTKVEYIDLESMGGANGDVLGVDITDNIILFYKPQRGYILLSWSKVKIPMPFFDELADRFKTDNPEYTMRRKITEKDGSCTNKTFIDVIDFFLEHKSSLINESIWADIHKRSNGSQERKEDDLNILGPDDFFSYLVSEYRNKTYYISKDHYCRDYDTDVVVNPIRDIGVFGSYSDDKLSRIMVVLTNRGYIRHHQAINNMLKLSDDRFIWDKGDEERFYVTGKNGDVNNKTFVDLIEFFLNNSIYESVWVDMHKRSTGEQVRKEDELTSDDYTILKEVLIMFGREVRFAINNNYKNFKYKLEDCVKYINVLIDSDFRGVDLLKLKKYVETNWEKDPIIQKIIGWTIDGKKSKEIDQEIRNEIKNDKTWNLNECDGVPGGITPADVGGMGEITFPGADGTPGSGDIPMPTGHVYQQVAPFGIFIRAKKGKKRKKKFRKEDEPCAHSPNAKVYDYVDDYREYVDRTYNNMDRK